MQLSKSVSEAEVFRVQCYRHSYNTSSAELSCMLEFGSLDLVSYPECCFIVICQVTIFVKISPTTVCSFANKMAGLFALVNQVTPSTSFVLKMLFEWEKVC